MARHDRPTWLLRRTDALGGAVTGWAMRTQTRWTAAREAARTARSPARRTATILAATAVAAAGYVALAYFAVHPLGARGARPGTPPALGSALTAGASVAGAAAAAAALPPPSAQPTPPAAAGPAVTPAAPVAASATLPSTTAAMPAAAPAPSASAAAATADADQPIASPPPLQRPVAGAVLAGFGWAYSPVLADWQEHTGLDLAAPIGQPVAAPAAGVVSAVRSDALWGWVVSLALDHGYSTNLSGLGQVAVTVGQPVRAGEVIGAAGPSPPAEGNLPPHVFWQLFAGTRAVDPLQP